MVFCLSRCLFGSGCYAGCSKSYQPYHHHHAKLESCWSSIISSHLSPIHVHIFYRQDCIQHQGTQLSLISYSLSSTHVKPHAEAERQEEEDAHPAFPSSPLLSPPTTIIIIFPPRRLKSGLLEFQTRRLRSSGAFSVPRRKGRGIGILSISWQKRRVINWFVSESQFLRKDSII